MVLGSCSVPGAKCCMLGTSVSVRGGSDGNKSDY